MQVESLVGNAGALKRVYGYRNVRKKKTKTNISEHCIFMKASKLTTEINS